MNKVKKFISYSIVMIFITLIIIFPDISRDGVSRGILISANIIIPALFPFTVCVLMILKSGFSITNRLVSKVTYTLFGHTWQMFFVFILSMVGGYPIGAKLISELYEQKIINKRTAEIMLLYCVNAGPAFIISVAGGAFTAPNIGIVLLISHILPSIVVAVFCSRLLKKEKNCYDYNNKNAKSFSENFVQSVADASTSMLQICSFVIIFSVINSYIDLFFKNTPIIKYISFFTEVTSAVTTTKNIYFISFLLGFGGLCIWCQIFAISNRKINFLKFVFSRIVHGSLSMLFTKMLLNILKIKITTFSSNNMFKSQLLYSDISVTISLVVLFFVFLIFIYTKNSSGKILKDMI